MNTSGTFIHSEQVSQIAAISAALESDIVSGALPAGTVLDEVWLSEKYRVERADIQSVMHTLVSRNLAERSYSKGLVVAQITRERIAQMFEALSEIDLLCVRLAAERMTLGEVWALEELHRQMGAMVEAEDYDDYDRANARFHDMICRSTKNPDLVVMRTGVRGRLIGLVARQVDTPARLNTSHDQHGAIVRALRNRDAVQAETALKTHIAFSAEHILSNVDV
ncbi:MAG: GntR family transcriptional regulator [Pseudomonadota bacterium]|nr:GntR family transcriptional regulator [Pseudomonadota bacterium]